MLWAQPFEDTQLSTDLQEYGSTILSSIRSEFLYEFPCVDRCGTAQLGKI